ncbi:hypothetical protein LY11_00313 [Pedobacter cryoconitis]|uniref:Uncharacterized protein n=1 Tax=Pedobacter cryoconitis TaxID=188932 RepID=A0A327THC4_9SPHI|nr:hypothetical protein LY11_00313 [Pedobacter cryoconitis]
MKTRKKSYLILLCSITLLAVSCKREDFKKTDVVNNSSSEIKVEDGYLSFSSYENFMKVFLNISNLNSSDRVK